MVREYSATVLSKGKYFDELQAANNHWEYFSSAFFGKGELIAIKKAVATSWYVQFPNASVNKLSTSLKINP
jgi:hypothetical protein